MTENNLELTFTQEFEFESQKRLLEKMSKDQLIEAYLKLLQAYMLKENVTKQIMKGDFFK